MGIVIGISGKEKNIGKTALSLFLGQGFCEVTNQSAIVIDLDTINPEIKYVLEKDSTNNYNIDNIMVYATVEGSNLESPIKSNITPFFNSKLNVIYGTTFRDRNYSDVQISNLIQSVKAMYDFIIIDLGEKEIKQSLYNNMDLVLVVVPASEKYIDTLKERTDLFHKKTEYVLNFNSKGLLMESLFRKQYQKDFMAVLPFEKTVQFNINKGYLDFEGGNYQDAVYALIAKVLERFNLGEKVSTKFLFGNDIVGRISNNKVIRKLLGGKQKEKTVEEKIRSLNRADKPTPRLGEILIEKGIITREQLAIALDEQNID